MIRGMVNGYTQRYRLADYMMLRAAEISLADGYPYFVIVGGQDLTINSSVTLPAYSQTTTNGFATGNYGTATASLNSSTVSVPSSSINVTIPEERITIKMLKRKSDAQGMALDAAIIRSSLAPKYIHTR